MIRSASMPGTLYVVATPIGNLGDLPPRAREVLESVSVIACEDTRHTGKLLARFEIRTKRISCHEHNEQERVPALLERLEAGDDVALVTDAGTPLVSDPGYRLVRATRQAGIPVRAVPGPSALLSALSVSGLPTSSFTFYGFLPARGAARREALDAATASPLTFVLFEAPSRVGRLLESLAERTPEREACLAREMTKRHEEHRAGTLAELAEWSRDRTFRGEITLVVGPQRERASPPSEEALAARFESLREGGLSAREASKRIAREHGIATRDIYNRFGR